MCKKGGSNLFFLVLGAAVGAAVGYVAASEKKDQWLQEVNALVDKVKGNVKSAVAKASQSADEVIEDAE